jgi:hypothetical protein
LALANVFDEKTDHVFEIPVLLKLTGAFGTGAVRITPEFRVGWTFVAQRPDNQITVGLVGSGLRTNIYGIKPPRGSLQLGAGAKFELSEMVDFFVNYDLDAARGFINHNAALGLGFNFLAKGEKMAGVPPGEPAIAKLSQGAGFSAAGLWETEALGLSLASHGLDQGFFV